jgi:hypothetical protein
MTEWRWYRFDASSDLASGPAFGARRGVSRRTARDEETDQQRRLVARAKEDREDDSRNRARARAREDEVEKAGGAGSEAGRTGAATSTRSAAFATGVNRTSACGSSQCPDDDEDTAGPAVCWWVLQCALPAGCSETLGCASLLRGEMHHARHHESATGAHATPSVTKSARTRTALTPTVHLSGGSICPLIRGIWRKGSGVRAGGSSTPAS